MNRVMKKGIVWLVILVMCLQFGSIRSEAGANVVIYLSSSSVSIGQNVTATVSISGSDVSAYTIYVSYSSDVLQFNSASGATVNGSGGTLTVSGTGSGSINISFTAIANGSASISTSGSEVYDINYNQLSISHAGATVTVETADNPDDKKTTEADQSEESTTEKPEDDGRSSNCNLASLQVSPGELSPGFSPSTTSYTLQVDEDVTSIVVSATAEDSKASTAVSGANAIQKGSNSVRVTVTAENGAVRIYNIRVIAGEDVGDPIVELDGVTYSFVASEDGLEIPEGFTSTKLEYKDWEVLAFEAPNKKLYVVCLQGEEGEQFWYIIDAKKDSFTPYQEYSSKYNRYIIIAAPEGTQIPEGFEAAELKIGENVVSAYQSADVEDSKIYLVYAMNLDGEEGFYLYDAMEDSFQRYVPMVVTEEKIVEATPTVATPAGPTLPPEDEGFFTKQVLTMFLFGAIALLVILLIMVIIFAGRIRKQNREISDADDMINQLASANQNVNSELLEKFEQKDAAETAGERKRKNKKEKVSPEETKKEQNQPEDETHTAIGEKLGAIAQIEIPTVKNEEETIPEIQDPLQGEAYVEKSEKELAHEAYEKRSEEINNHIMTNYDMKKDSVFASEEDLKS